VEPNEHLANLIVIWAVVAGLILLTRTMSKRPGAGLVQAYVMNLALLHWVAASLYLLPWYTNHDPLIVTAGLEQSLWAVSGFGIGSLLLAPVLLPAMPSGARSRVPRLAERQLARKYIQAGVIAFFGLAPVLGRIPTVAAIAVQGWNLLVVGFVVTCWQVWRARTSPLVLGRWLTATLCLPLVTIVAQGFIGYGMSAALAILAFIGNFYRPFWRVLACGVLLGYVGLSLYVTYMRDRQEIRDVVWAGQPILDRVERVATTLTTIEAFDLHNEDHLVRVDDRLNQNLLVGAAVQYMDAGLADFAYGQTLWQGFIAVVPRAIWPSKPVVAGSGTLVTQYTGIQFAEGTAVGIGHVMEAYVSFGTAGVLIGFVLMGAALGIVDDRAGSRLSNADLVGFVKWYLPGLSALQVGGSIVELTSSVAAAVVAAHTLAWLVAGRPRRV
jgi:hypothetical protein